MIRTRFPLLDGIRGIAALFVVVFHAPQLMHFSFYRSYLAVDLFFMLSGFVIAHAYDHKIYGSLKGIGKFMGVRLLRLYPVFFLSVIISGVCGVITRDSGGSFMDIAKVSLLSLFFIPGHLPANHFLFSLNVPYWSLLYELVVNFFYALGRSILNNRLLFLLILVASAALIVCAAKYRYMNLGSSWGTENFRTGLSRSTFGFFAGLFLYRNRTMLSQRFKWPSALVLSVVVLILASPSAGRFDPLLDLFAIMVAFPACVLAGAQASEGRGEKVLAVLGSASYPLYVLHYPLVQLTQHFVNVEQTGLGTAAVFLIVVTAMSVVVERGFDIPFRRWVLKNRLPVVAKSRVA